MGDELIHQLTLNFLLTNEQRQKLNKKRKEIVEQEKQDEILLYKDRIKELFNDLLVLQPPEDLLYEVNSSFDHFVSKCIYYFKSHDVSKNRDLEKTDICDDIDFEKEERDIANGNYLEDEGEDEDEDEDEDPIVVNGKYKKNQYSKGVEDINNVELNWFQQSVERRKKEKIVPRKSS
jgi:hypothetical protein